MSEAIGVTNVRNGSIEEDWQVLELTWKDRLAHLYHTDLMSDVTFKVKEERIKAHKLVLASVSSVFYAMFYGPVAETRSEIEIVDCPNAEDFEEFLSFVYNEDLFLTWDNFFPIAYLAKKYYIPSLTKECCKFLSDSLKVENVLEVLSQCVHVNEKEMINQCLQLIRVRIRELTRTEDFLKLDLPSLECILACQILDIEELDLFLAVDKWCKYQLEQKGEEVTPEGKRELLGNVVKLVRFPTLSVKVLTNTCLPSGLITQGQFVDLVSFLMSEETNNDKKIDTKKIPFAKSSRKRTNGCFLKDSTAFTHWHSHGTRFQMQKVAWLKGVKLIGEVQDEGNSSRVCIVKRKDGVSVKPKFSIKVTHGKGGKKMSYLIFTEAVELLPWVEYDVLCIRGIDMESISMREEKILGRLTTPTTSSWKQVPECFVQQGVSYIGQSEIKGCYEEWHNFPEFILSTFDNQPIPNEEDLLLKICKG